MITKLKEILGLSVTLPPSDRVYLRPFQNPLWAFGKATNAAGDIEFFLPLPVAYPDDYRRTDFLNSEAAMKYPNEFSLLGVSIVPVVDDEPQFDALKEFLEPEPTVSVSIVRKDSATLALWPIPLRHIIKLPTSSFLQRVKVLAEQRGTIKDAVALGLSKEEQERILDTLSVPAPADELQKDVAPPKRAVQSWCDSKLVGVLSGSYYRMNLGRAALRINPGEKISVMVKFPKNGKPAKNLSVPLPLHCVVYGLTWMPM